MDIAIVAPSPVPYAIGGAENFWWGMLNYINQHTRHRAELIKLPYREPDLWHIIDSYISFWALDLSHFDLVISSKYPAWMVQHPNHYCYLQHRLRGLYDTYHFTGFPEAPRTDDLKIRTLLSWMEQHRSREALAEGVDRIRALRHRVDLPPYFFDFPGPFSRQVVHFLDGCGINPESIRRFAAISETVAARKDYFPSRAKVDVIYHPSNLPHFKDGSFDYLFSIGRLDNAKRIGLLVEAMQHVSSNVQLKIAGAGPDESRIREIAGDDPRIEFLGFINDVEAVDLYANSLAALYVPYDEDYGLVTIEAMMSGKPVLTATDSGGSNEFVRNGETGFSVAPEPAALAERIDYLCRHREEARAMGARGKDFVKDITWENTIDALLQERPPPRSPRGRRRKKLTVASTYRITPPLGGGQHRVFHIYRHLAKSFDVDLITLDNYDEQPLDEFVAPGLREIRIPKSEDHHWREADLSGLVSAGLKEWVPITDVAFPRLFPRSPAYLERLAASAAEADVVIASHPYTFAAVRAVTDKRVWLDAHNIEYTLKQKVLPPSDAGVELLEQTRQLEEQAARAAELILVCARSEGAELSAHYGLDESKIVEVPNGVNLEASHYVSPAKRAAVKARLGLQQTFTAIFLGAWHNPNLEAVEFIIKTAPSLPDINFLVIGSSGLAFQQAPLPANVGLLGVAEEEMKNHILSFADVALNPMQSGAGTNLKMLDYFAAGVPVISTSHGARGLGAEDGVHLKIADINEFPSLLRAARDKQLDLDAMVERARDYTARAFDWAVIAENFRNELERRGLLTTT